MYYHQIFFFFKQKTAYEMRISGCSSDVCSSDVVMYLRHAAFGAVQWRATMFIGALKTAIASRLAPTRDWWWTTMLRPTASSCGSEPARDGRTADLTRWHYRPETDP